jgi:hypothetical protein
MLLNGYLQQFSSQNVELRHLTEVGVTDQMARMADQVAIKKFASITQPIINVSPFG